MSKEKTMIYSAWLEADQDNNVLVFAKNNENAPKILLQNLGKLDGYDAHEQIALMYQVLDSYNMQITPVETKKNKDKGLVRDGKKIFLKLANEDNNPQGYNLFLKGTDKFIYRINKDGIFVTNSPKVRKTIFSKRDIGFIENIEDFDIKKADKKVKWIANKVAPDLKGDK